LVVALLVVPGIVVGGTVVPESTEVMVVSPPEVVLVEVSLPVVLAPDVAEAADEAAEEAAEAAEEAAEEAALSMLLAAEEASEAMLEAAALPDARADERAAEIDEMRGGTATPVVDDWPSVSPERRPRATRARVWAFIL
jgi:hypothetical protein